MVHALRVSTPSATTFRPERVADVDDSAHERCVGRALAEPVDEADVDLQLVEREHAQRRERRGSAGVVEREPDAEGGEAARAPPRRRCAPAPGPAGHDLERDGLRRRGRTRASIDARPSANCGSSRSRYGMLIETPELVPRLRPLLGRAECVGDDEEGELAHERRSLDVRDELGRRDESAVRQDATDQRLGGVRASRSRGRGSAGRRRGARSARAPSRRRGRCRRRCRGGATASRRPCPASSRTSARRRARADPAAVAPSSGNTAQPMLPSISTAVPSMLNGLRSAWRRRPDERCRALVAPGSDREDDELVAADARDRVRLAHDRLEPARERLQHAVACAVTADVVDVLEAVEVDRDERERLARPSRAAERLLDAVVEQHAVGQPGQRVADEPPSGRCRGARLRRTPTAAATNAHSTRAAMT